MKRSAHRNICPGDGFTQGRTLGTAAAKEPLPWPIPPPILSSKPFTTGGVQIDIDATRIGLRYPEFAWLNTPGPVMVDCIVDPHEPPRPRKIKASQAKQFASALASGTPHRGKIALTVASDNVREML